MDLRSTGFRFLSLGGFLLICLVWACCSVSLADGALVVVTRPIRVAVQAGLWTRGEPGLMTVLNNPNYYNFQATLVSDSAIDTEAKIRASFDVVFLGASGSELDVNNISSAAATAIRTFVQNGGGLVTAAWLSAGINSASLKDTLQPVVPVQFSSDFTVGCQQTNNPGLSFASFTHPVASGMQSLVPIGSSHGFSANGIYSTATSLANLQGSGCVGLTTDRARQGVVVFNPGSGRSVYLSPIYTGLLIMNSQNARSSFGERLLKNALYWASSVPPLCQTVTCQNGGVCSGPNTCNCTGTGYTGDECETPVCATPCQYGGRCIQPNVCNCTGTGYTGGSCQTAECIPMCVNQGVCYLPDTCSCPSNYNGSRCENAICTPSCLNNGFCQEPPNVCNCSSAPGYNGDRCQNPICSPECQNGGQCASPGVCNCTGTNRTGNYCEQFICDPPCAHGTCREGNVCDCTGTSYNGTLCDNPLCDPECERGFCSAPNKCNCAGTDHKGPTCSEPICVFPCNNGGTCIAPNTCNCTDAWLGQYCQIRNPTTTGTTGTTGTTTGTTGTTGTSGTTGTTGTTGKSDDPLDAIAGSGELFDGLSNGVAALIGIGLAACCLFCGVGCLFSVCSGKKQQQRAQQLSAVNLPMHQMPSSPPSVPSSGYFDDPRMYDEENH